MKRLLAILAICALLAPGVAWGAISSTMVWEISPTATAANVNGCGYKPGASGTDYSQQDAAQWNLTGVTTVFLTDPNLLLNANAAATMVGNLAHIISGTNATAGWYEITAVNPGVSITVTGAANASTDNMALGVVNIGGACNLGGALDGDMFAAVTAGNTIYVKDGDYTAGEAITGTAGADASQIKLYGYYATRADALDGDTTGTNRPSIDMGANSFTCTTGYWDLRNVVLTGTAVNVCSAGVSSYLENLKVSNTSGTANRNALYAQDSSVVFNCELVSTNGYALYTGFNPAFIKNNYIHDSSIGIFVHGSSMSIINNIIDTCSTTGIYGEAATKQDMYIVGNTLYGADHATADAITSGSADRWYMFNNIIANWNVGIVGTGTQLTEDYNNFFGNDTDRSGVATGVHSIALDPQFVDAANADFRVGPNMKSKAFPSAVTLPGTSANGKGYTDMGALQMIGLGGGAWATQ